MEHSTLIYSLVLFASALGGASLFFFRKGKSGISLKITLAFSAAYLLGLVLLHLFPELFESPLHQPGWYVLMGFMLQVILDFFSHGVEHGHAHTHQHATSRFFIAIMVSLWIHAFIEGMPFGGDASGHHHLDGSVHDHRQSLLLGISIHKITEAFVFMSLLVHSGFSRKKAFFWLIIFALMAPLGAFTHVLLAENGSIDIDMVSPAITGILIGILLHVSTTILFESEEGHRFNWMKFVAILLGIGLSALVAM
jgi:zinc transporter ZupT